MKGQLVGSLAERRRRMESGEDVVVGVNKFDTTEPNPLTADLDTAIMTVDPAVEAAAQEAVKKWRAERDQQAADKALDALREAASSDVNLMPATLECARAGVTTGEWAGVLREVFGEYRAPTGVSAASGGGEADEALIDIRERVRATGEELGGRLRFLVGKPGLDGHSNGAEQIAVRARDAGFEVIYQGIRLTPAQIVSAAVEEDVHVVGLSVLSGSHLQVVPAVLQGLEDAGLDDVPVIVGGIIPDSDARRLRELGVARVFTPKDFGLTEIMGQVVDVVREANDLPTHPAEKVPAPA
jgi:(2R)-ethylmalonyl-CoA mutase